MISLGSLLLAGCANAADTGPEIATARSGPPVTGTSAAATGDAKAFVTCMRDAGVQVDDAKPGQAWQMKPGDKTDPDFPDAMAECKSLLPAGSGGAPVISEEQLTRMREFAQCMRSNGVPDFADPGPNGFASAPKDAAAAERATRTCGAILGIDPNAPHQG
ncbi:hypothetical protein [Actinoplanes couchii]|uniref:hypothetical protein n=1 Tax=Actinoplanes couchii TaxID=403638 RepID=UPI001943128E|nr:hypothetical protein [Actinoplanes couchii]MDR6319064.1 hypothetical protein [Actinoplanes couchii]